LAWSAPLADGGAGITGYAVYRGTTTGTGTLVATVGAVTTFADTSVVNGTTYYYAVAAVNAAGEGPRSAERSAMPATVPGAPALTSAVASDRKVTLAWSPPASSGGAAITGYKVYRGPSSGSETLLATLGDTTGYEDTTVANGGTYVYVVTAVNARGE